MTDPRALNAFFDQAISALQLEREQLAAMLRDSTLTLDQHDQLFARYKSVSQKLAAQRWLRSQFWVLYPL